MLQIQGYLRLFKARANPGSPKPKMSLVCAAISAMALYEIAHVGLLLGADGGLVIYP